MSIVPTFACIHWICIETTFGQTLLAATARGVCLLQFCPPGTDPVDILAGEFPGTTAHAAEGEMAARLQSWLCEVIGEVENGIPAKVPLDLVGTPFQLRVWAHLRRLQRGITSTYREVAEAIEHPRAVRAVASACARNRVALLVPCHRVTRTGGALAGYRWGLERKRALLFAETNTASA